MKKQEKKKFVNMNIDFEKPAFWANSITVVAGKPFTLDFKQITQRYDEIGPENQMTLAVKHMPILIEPVMAKQMIKILEMQVKNYEKKEGEIRVPKKKREKKIVSKGQTYIG